MASSTCRPRRSVLYMPGSNPRALEKGRSLPADGLILDIEDAVAPDAKSLAREQIVSALAAGGYGKREIMIRTNGLETEWGEADLKAAATSGADAVLLPKVESAQMIQAAEQVLSAAGAPADQAIWCMMETPLGMLHAEEIAFASPRVGGFVLGTSDLAKDLNAAHVPSRMPFMWSLEVCVLAAKAAKIGVLDGVHLDLNDADGFRASCVQGKELGMDGKTLIHPKTIAMANEVFAPSAEDVAWAEKIIAAHEDASAKGEGVVVVDGKLVENLHVESAERLVAMAKMIQEMDTTASN